MPLKVSAAVDLGYGHVKYACAQGGKVSLGAFPSYVSIGAGGTMRHSLAALGQLDLVTVQVGGRAYAVGNDSPLTGNAAAVRNRDPGFSTTNSYMALMLGALWSLKAEVIDLLVVGLPMNTLHLHDKELVRRLTGEHIVPDFRVDNRGDGASNIVVKVREVICIGQPVGALLDVSTTYPDIKSERAIVLDLGFNTLDVLAIEGGRPRTDRIDAFPGGVAGFIDELKRCVELSIRQQYPDIQENVDIPSHHYEQALRDNKPLLTGLGPIDLKPHAEVAAARLEQYLDKVANLIGEKGDITCAVLAGGGASLIEEPFRRRFRTIRNIVIPRDPEFSVVRGFLSLGRTMLLEREATHE